MKTMFEVTRRNRFGFSWTNEPEPTGPARIKNPAQNAEQTNLSWNALRSATAEASKINGTAWWRRRVFVFVDGSYRAIARKSLTELWMLDNTDVKCVQIEIEID